MDRLPGAPRAARRALVGTAPLRLEAVAACAISCLVLLCTAPSAHEFVSDADHGLQLAGALQVAFGRHPFLDFETAVYGPAVFYASYLGQWLSGWRLVGEVALVLLGYTAGYGLLFVLLHRIVGEGEASWARRAARWTLFLGLVLLAPRFYKYYLVLGPALFLLALHAYAQERGQRHLAWLGLATCALGLFRLDFAAYGVVAAVAAVLFTPAGSRRTPSSSCLGSLALFGAWGCLGAAPWLAFLAIRGDLLAVAARTLETTLAHRTGMALEAAPFSLEAGPFDGTNRLLVGFWALRLLPLVLLAALGGSWRRLEPGPRAFAIGLCLFAALSFLQASHRVDPSHLLQALPAQLVVVAWLAGAAFSRGRPALALLACLAGLVPPLLATGAPLALRKGGRGTLPERLRDWVRPVSELRDAALYAPETWPRLFAATAAFVNEVSTPQTGVLFLPIFPQLYWLSGRGFTAPLGWVQPGPWRDTSEERRFVQGLSSTRLVVDIPSALIGRDPDRNLRVYAPRIARHVYTRYGILRRIAWVYVLTDDPTLLDAHGAFPARYEEAPVPLAPDSQAPPCALTGVNTLPPGGEPVPILRGSGLVLRCRLVEGSSPQRAEAALPELALARDGAVFRATPHRLATRRVTGEHALARGPEPVREFETFAGTVSLEAGLYEVVVLEAAQREPAAPRLHHTGHWVSLEPP